MEKAFDEGVHIKNNMESVFHCILLSLEQKGVLARPHFHDYIEILFGKDCDLDIWVNDENFTLHKGELIVFNSGETHAVYSDRDENSYYVIKFFPDVLSSDKHIFGESRYILPLLGKQFSEIRKIRSDEIEKAGIDRIIEQIYREWDGEQFGYEMALRGGSLMLYAQLVRIWSKDISLFESQDETVKIIQAAASYAIENFMDISEKDISKHFGMSYSYFSRMFKKVMNKSFTAFINELRIDHARRLLLTTNHSVTYIAQNTGFSSSSHFICKFREMTGYSPLEYRKMYIN